MWRIENNAYIHVCEFCMRAREVNADRNAKDKKKKKKSVGMANQKPPHISFLR